MPPDRRDDWDDGTVNHAASKDWNSGVRQAKGPPMPSQSSARGFPGTRFASVDELADRIERDRREPDKILLYVSQLRGVASELRDIQEWAEKPEGDAYLRMTHARVLLWSIARPT